MSTRFLNTSRDGDSIASLGSLFQCLTTLSVKKFVLISNPLPQIQYVDYSRTKDIQQQMPERVSHQGSSICLETGTSGSLDCLTQNTAWAKLTRLDKSVSLSTPSWSSSCTEDRLCILQGRLAGNKTRTKLSLLYNHSVQAG